MQKKQTHSGSAGDVVRLLKLRSAAANSAPLRGRKPLHGVELPGNSHFLSSLSSRKLSGQGAQLDIQLDVWNAGSGWKEVR